MRLGWGLAFGGIALAASAKQVFYVAPNGHDGGPGTRARPFATLERARDAIRELKHAGGLRRGGITVVLEAGIYRRDNSFELDAEDSGWPGSPIVYRGAANAMVRLVGGRAVTNWVRVTDAEVLSRLEPRAQENVWQADLKALGIRGYGELSRRGFGIHSPAAQLELFFRNQPMTLARWPNHGWAAIAAVPGGPHSGRFTYAGDRPRRWRRADSLWVHGYWTWDWADSYEKVKAIDLDRHQIVTEPPHGVYGYKPGARWYALNLLEELDSPGEYYLERRTGVLYFWPPGRLQPGRAYVSLLAHPVVRMRCVHDLVLQGLTFEVGRGVGLELDQCTNLLVAGCTLRDLGTTAIVLSGRRDGIQSCHLYALGDGGISLNGGDRQTLSPGGDFVDNCDIHDFGRWSQTYHPGIGLEGVGNRISHNLIYEAPHSAILGGGNDNQIEFNEIHHVCRETSDAGAFYMGRDLTQRGNVIRYNYFHDLDARPDVQAVYLDDCLCGTTVFGNVFCRAGRGVMVGGGRDNLVENNVFVDCHPAVHVDARGKGWAKSWFDGQDLALMSRLEAVHFDRPPYSVRYPRLARILEDDPAMPKGNRIVRNIAVGGRWLDLLDHLTTNTVVVQDNFVDGDPGFVAPARRDFRLRPDSPVWKLGFQRIPWGRIGLYHDAYRRSARGAFPR